MREREAKAAAREKELDALRNELQGLIVTLEASAATERQDIGREQARTQPLGSLSQCMLQQLLCCCCAISCMA